MNKNVEKSNMTIEERLYKTPMVYVVSLSAAAALALCLAVALIMLVIGFGYTSDYLEDGTEVRYFGVMRRGTPTFGWINDSKGNRGFISGDRVKYSDGSRYDGELSGFCYNGDGRYTDAEGNVYTGSFYLGKLQGSVHIDYADGGSFDGEYLDGKRHGYGVETHPQKDGSFWGYEGNYSEGEESGYGVYTYPDGSVYKGNFLNGMRHGEGVYRFPSGDSYTGSFRHNVFHGTGSYFFSSGRVFSGEFNCGLPIFK